MSKSNSDQYYLWTIGLLVAMHLAGFLGLQYHPTRAFFEFLVPFNLITSTALLFLYQQEATGNFLKFAFFVFCFGYLIEWAGVQSGLIFGEYYYETTLGVKLFGVPVIIGLNWLILVVSTGIIGQTLFSSLRYKIILGASLMVFLDFLIEPVAIQHNFWDWSNTDVPLQNYVAWFFVSAFLLLGYHLLPFPKKNRIAIPLYLTQFMFFLAHNVTYL